MLAAITGIFQLHVRAAPQYFVQIIHHSFVFFPHLCDFKVRVPLNVSFKVKGRDVVVDIQQHVSMLSLISFI